MSTQDYYFLIYAALCSLTMIIFGIIQMIKTKDKETFVTNFLMMLVGFTPGATLLVSIFICFYVMFILYEIPAFLFKILKKDSE